MGSTRPGRIGEQVAKWAYEIASMRKDIEVELVDLLDYNLPLFDEPNTPKQNKYTKDYTKKWSEKISEADGYIFVTAEYNHSVPAAFKNAIDYLFYEWNNKSVGFIGYGVNGGSRAIEHWRTIAGEMHLADVREHLLLYLDRDFENYSVFKPRDNQAEFLNKVIDEVKVWGEALETTRLTKKD